MMGFCGEKRCEVCGSENHVTEDHGSSPMGSPTVLSVTRYNCTTEYVSKADHDAELVALRQTCNWQWYENHRAEFERRMAEAAHQIELLKGTADVLREKLHAAEVREANGVHALAALREEYGPAAHTLAARNVSLERALAAVCAATKTVR